MKYTVQSGDTLFAISRRFSVPLPALMAENELNGDKIQVGRVLTIPAVTTDAADLLSSTKVTPLTKLPLTDNLPISRSLELPQDQFKHDVYQKLWVTLHHTGGTSASGAAWSWRSTKVEVATAFMVDTEKAYQMFPADRWAYHLGIPGAESRDWYFDRHSIGIEIVNAGQLVLRGSKLCMWPNNFQTTYCDVSDTKKYVKLDKPWRGYQYFAAFPDRQVKIVAGLVQMLCERFKIPKRIFPEDKRYEKNIDNVIAMKGVVSHANFLSEKLDLGPAFPWDKLELSV